MREGDVRVGAVNAKALTVTLFVPGCPFTVHDLIPGGQDMSGDVGVSLLHTTAAMLEQVRKLDFDHDQASPGPRRCLKPSRTGLRDGVACVHHDGVAQLEVGDGEFVDHCIAFRNDRYSRAPESSLGGIDAQVAGTQLSCRGLGQRRLPSSGPARDHDESTRGDHVLTPLRGSMHRTIKHGPADGTLVHGRCVAATVSRAAQLPAIGGTLMS